MEQTSILYEDFFFYIIYSLFLYLNSVMYLDRILVSIKITELNSIPDSVIDLTDNIK